MNLMNNQNLQEEKNDSQPAATPLAAAADSHQPMIEKENPLTDMPLAAAGSQQPISMSIPELQEEKNGTQPAATPLASDADSRQPGSVSNHGIEEEKKGKDPQVPATNRNLQEAGSHQLGSAMNPDMNDPQVPAMHLAAGSHQLISGLDSIIELELPSEGSVLVVDSSRVPADAQEVSRIELKKLVNNDSIKISFRTSNPD